MNNPTTPKGRFQFSLLTLVTAVVFLGACTGLWAWDERHTSASSLPVFCAALISLVPLLCFAFQTWVIGWQGGLRYASDGQLVMSVLFAWGVAYGWTAVTVAITAQRVGSLTPVLWLTLLSVWFVCLCRAACAVYALNGRWTNLGIGSCLLISAVVIIALCFLFALALVGLIWVHFAAGGSC